MSRLLTIIILALVFTPVVSAEELSIKKLLTKLTNQLQAQTELLAQIEANTALPEAEISDPPLRALWGEGYDGFSCFQFVFLDSGFRASAPSNWVRIQLATDFAGQDLTGFGTRNEAEDWLINFFIRMNGLDATLDDVPLDGTGQRDCQTWNDQLVTQ